MASESLSLTGRYHIECYDQGGRLKWTADPHNVITTEGLNHLLNVELHGATAVATWYCALASTNTAAASTMTYATPSFTEFTLYDEATRPAYNEASSAAASITNSANKAVFTISATVTTPTIYGAALLSSSVKGDTATTGGVLFSYALLSTSRAVVAADVINLSYTVSAS